MLEISPEGVYPAMHLTAHAVSFYLAISPLPCKQGGIFSVALSMALRPPDFSGLLPVVSGLSSLPLWGRAVVWYRPKCKCKPLLGPKKVVFMPVIFAKCTAFAKSPLQNLIYPDGGTNHGNGRKAPWFN